MHFIYSDEATATAGASSPDIASLLVKNGGLTAGSSDDIIPNIETGGNQEGLQQAQEKEAAQTVETTAGQSTTSEHAAPGTDEKQEAITAPVYNWKEDAKKADIAEILKDVLGFDDKMVGFVNKWRTDGNIADYIRAVSVDYSKMTPEQLLRQQIAEEYPEFSPEDREALYNYKVTQQYKLDPNQFDEKEVAMGKILIAAETKKIREELIRKQQDYILNAKPPAQPNYAQEAELAARQQEEMNKKVLEQYSKAFEIHPVTKELLSNKHLVIGEGEDKFNYELPEPSKLLEILKDSSKWAQEIFETDGTPKVEKQLFLAAAALDHKALAAQIFNAGKNAGAKSTVDKLQNAKNTNQPTSTPEPALTPAQALARQGIFTFDS